MKKIRALNARLAFTVIVCLIAATCSKDQSVSRIMSARNHAVMDFIITQGPNFALVCDDGITLYLTFSEPVTPAWTLKDDAIVLDLPTKKVARLIGLVNESQRKHGFLGYIFKAEEQILHPGAHRVSFKLVDVTGKELFCEANFTYRPYP